MKEKKIYLHIGFSKTGSSSLQSYLTFNPEHKVLGSDEKTLYCCFNLDGSISYGKELTKMAEGTHMKYAASHHEIANSANLSKTKNGLDKLFEAGYTPIFSHEDWARRAGEFERANFFTTLDCSAHVIAYVRPQVEWLNSAWWQWYAWDSKFSTPSDVVGAWGYAFMKWGDQLARWKTVTGVESLKVRLQPQDIVADFMSQLGLQENPNTNNLERNNVSLSPTLIKLLLRYPELRDVHGAEVDIILSNLFKFEGKVPWIIEKELISKIIDATRTDNLQLQNMLDEQSKIVMENDPRWWNHDFYNTRSFISKANLELDNQELLSIVDQAIPALIKHFR